MIVKIQIPLYSSEENPMALVYDKKRKYEQFIDIDHTLLTIMAGRKKAYFNAQIDDDGVYFETEAPGQDW